MKPKSSPPRIRIGCGSWADDAYVGRLYPKGWPSNQRLACYATWFDHVEVNSSYYAMPRRETTAQWVKQTPPGFLFDIKLHRALSRSPRKAPEGRLLDLLLKGVAPLIRAGKLGTFLLVLDPSFAPDKHGLEELDGVIAALRPHPLAVELRDGGWVTAKRQSATLGYFREKAIAWVATDMPPLRAPSILPKIDEVTDPRLAYLRLQGRNRNYLEAGSAAERHDYAYPSRELKQIVARIQRLGAEAAEVRVVANNHHDDFAPQTALALRRLLGLTMKPAQP